MAVSDELAFVLQNGFGGNLHYVITPPPQLSVLFVTVHANAIVVTIRIGLSIADMIGGGDNADVCPGWQTLSRHC